MNPLTGTKLPPMAPRLNWRGAPGVIDGGGHVVQAVGGDARLDVLHRLGAEAEVAEAGLRVPPR